MFLFYFCFIFLVSHSLSLHTQQVVMSTDDPINTPTPTIDPPIPETVENNTESSQPSILIKDLIKLIASVTQARLINIEEGVSDGELAVDALEAPDDKVTIPGLLNKALEPHHYVARFQRAHIDTRADGIISRWSFILSPTTAATHITRKDPFPTELNPPRQRQVSTNKKTSSSMGGSESIAFIVTSILVLFLAMIWGYLYWIRFIKK